jgi:hypothetical protein
MHTPNSIFPVIGFGRDNVFAFVPRADPFGDIGRANFHAVHGRPARLEELVGVCERGVGVHGRQLRLDLVGDVLVLALVLLWK